jgi:hypothetical protein
MKATTGCTKKCRSVWKYWSAVAVVKVSIRN